MTRWALLLEYDGSPFVGWQRQVNGISVQEVLEQAASNLNGGKSVASIVAGRTDSGVHALGQVAHFDLVKDFDAGKSAEEIMKTIELPAFKTVRGYNEQIGRAAERIYHYYEMGW